MTIKQGGRTPPGQIAEGINYVINGEAIDRWWMGHGKELAARWLFSKPPGEMPCAQLQPWLVPHCVQTPQAPARMTLSEPQWEQSTPM